MLEFWITPMTGQSPIFRKLLFSAVLLIGVTLLAVDFYLTRYMDGHETAQAERQLEAQGGIDPLEKLCEIANEAGAWIHVDGAFGLWAAASKKKYALIRGFEKADSWSADAHKTLNAPYDCGIVLCKDRSALVNAMQATGSYIQYSDSRDGMLYTPEMSRRARSIELWAALKYLGKTGVSELVDTLCSNAEYFAEKLSESGFYVLNAVVFNQILIKCETSEKTKSTLLNIQSSGECWCGGAVWNNEPVIRISVCSWQTTRQDIDHCVNVFIKCREDS